MARPLTASDLPPDLARFAEAEIAAGHFASVEDVLRAGKEALEHEQEGRALPRAAIATASGEDAPLDRVRAKHGLPPRPAGRKSLAQLFAESPLKGLDLKIERDRDEGRPVGL